MEGLGPQGWAQGSLGMRCPSSLQCRLSIAEVNGVGALQAQRAADGLVCALLRHQQRHPPDVAPIVHRQHEVQRQLAQQRLRHRVGASAASRAQLEP